MRYPQRHGRVAFPLPYVPLALHWLRPTPYPEAPQTLGEHLQRARGLAGIRQADVAAKLGITMDTYCLWENDRAKPTIRYWPALVEFIGYDPVGDVQLWDARVRAKRRALGLTMRAAAALAGVDEGTFRRWERGIGPHQSKKALANFLRDDANLPQGSGNRLG